MNIDYTFNQVTLNTTTNIIESLVNGTTYFQPVNHVCMELPPYLHPDNHSPNPLPYFTPNQGWSADLIEFKEIMDFCASTIFPFYNNRLPDLLNETDNHMIENFFRSFVMALLDRSGCTSCYAVKIEAAHQKGKPTIYKSVKILSSSELVEKTETIQMRFVSFTLKLTNITLPTTKKKNHYCISNFDLANTFKQNNITLRDTLKELIDLYSQYGTDEFSYSINLLLHKLDIDCDISVFKNPKAAKKQELSLEIMGAYTLMCWSQKELFLLTF